MNWSMLYVDEYLRRAAREGRHDGDRYREEWYLARRAEALGTRRALARWLGDRLVGAGERLRAWSAPRRSVRISHR